MPRSHRHASRHRSEEIEGCSTRSGGAFTSPGAERHYAPDLEIEPQHLDIDLRFELDRKTVHAVVILTVRARVGGRRALRLDAIDLHGLSVEAADDHALASNYDGRNVELLWDAAIEQGEERRVRMSYSLTDPMTGMLFSWPDEQRPDAPKLVATDHETERARYWLPCLDHPSARQTLDIHLTSDRDHCFLANGVQISDELGEDGSRTVHWKLEFPCPSYLICLAVGELRRAEGGEHQGLEIAFFAPTSYSVEQLQRSFGPTKQMLDWMTAKLDTPFPFPKYFQLAVPEIGGAMENISLVTWDDSWVMDETLHSERGWLVDLINLHEMAHSYFGDSVVCRDYAHVWLKESWATYMESCWLEDTQGQDALQWQLHEEERAYRAEADGRYQRPIVTRTFNSSWDMFDQHLYPGGAWRIHMLRGLVGDESFWRAVQDYLATYQGEVVETADFRRKLEQHSGRSLARFFDQWLHSPGYPQLKATLSFDKERGEAVLIVQQTQSNKKKGVGLFRCPIEVAFETEGGWIERELLLEGERASLVVRLDKRPLQVVIDPRCRLLHKLDFQPGADSLKRSLGHAPTLRGRIHAARALGKDAKRSGIQALRQAYEVEPHWGVRIEIARALSEAGSDEAVTALSELLLVEDDPVVRPVVATLCGGYRDPRIAAALRELLGRDIGYMARAAALISLGAQRGERDLDLLREAAQDEGWARWVRRGAMTALGATRSEPGRALLRQHAADRGEAPQVRKFAIPALASSVSWQDEHARKQSVELLIDLCRDPNTGIRLAAGRALGGLKAKAALPALRALEHNVPGQEAPRVQRAIQAIQQGARAGGADKKLREQVEELAEKLRKLESKLALLEGRAGRD